MGQIVIEYSLHQAMNTLHGAASSATRCMQNNGSAFLPDPGERARDGGQPLGSEPAQLDQNRGASYPADDVDRAVLVRVAHHIELPIERAAV